MPPRIAPWLAEVIGRERGGKGWNVTELARKAGVDRSTVELLESAQANPTVETLEKLCEALGINLVSLFTDAYRRRAAGSPGRGKREAAIEPAPKGEDG